MDDYFEIPVMYKGEERSFTSRLLMTGYSHKFEVQVDEQLILFEPDEDQNYRAIIDQSQLEKISQMDVNLLQAIAEVIESIRN